MNIQRLIPYIRHLKDCTVDSSDYLYGHAMSCPYLEMADTEAQEPANIVILEPCPCGAKCSCGLDAAFGVKRRQWDAKLDYEALKFLLKSETCYGCNNLDEEDIKDEKQAPEELKILRGTALACIQPSVVVEDGMNLDVYCFIHFHVYNVTGSRFLGKKILMDRRTKPQKASPLKELQKLYKRLASSPK